MRLKASFSCAGACDVFALESNSASSRLGLERWVCRRITQLARVGRRVAQWRSNVGVQWFNRTHKCAESCCASTPTQIWMLSINISPLLFQHLFIDQHHLTGFLSQLLPTSAARPLHLTRYLVGPRIEITCLGRRYRALPA